MVSLLKSFFGKRELTDEELYSEYKKSKKTVKDFEKYIMNIKEGKETVAIKEIHGLVLSNIQDIDELIEILERNNINKGISLSTNRDKKKLFGLYNQLKSISYIQKNFLKDDEIIKNFIYSNKFDLLNYLRKKYEKNKNESFLAYIYDTYFNQQNYLPALEYFLFKDYENDIKFLIPNLNNYIQIQTKNAIPEYVNLSDIYYNLNDHINNKVNNLLLNLIVYFYTNHNNEIISKDLDKYIRSQNTELIEIILSLYGLAKKTDSSLTLETFIKNKKLMNNFKKISSVDYEIFSQVLNNIISNVREYSKIYKGLKYLPLEIMQEMIISKANNDLITKGIDIIINSNEYNNTSVLNFIIKLLFDYYCYNKVSLIQLSKIINYLSKYNTNYNKITNQLKSLIEIIGILEAKNCKFIINELVIDDIYDISKDNIFIHILIDYFNTLYESNMKYNIYNFIDKNILDLNKLIFYKKKFSYGKLLLYYFEIYENKRPVILNIISSNKNINLEKDELKFLIDLYLLNPYLIKVESYEFIEDFLDDMKNKITGKTWENLENLLDYLKIKKFTKKYKIDESIFKDYTLDNYVENIPQIMNILLTETYNLDKIQNIQTFLNSQQSKDIQNSLKLIDNKYIFFLFKLLLDKEKMTLVSEILELYIQNNNSSYFNKCIDYIYNNYCKKNDQEFRNFCKNACIDDYLLENNNKYLDILINKDDFSKDETIRFPLEKQSNDIIFLYSMIKSNKIKKEDNKSLNDLFISYDKYNNNDKKNLNNLINFYYRNKEDDESNNRVNYNYSLHPKLIELLKAKKYFYLFQDLKITFKIKIKIYHFCIKNKICTLTDIINNFETIKLKQKTRNDANFLEKYKLLFNLYQPNNENNDKVFKELYNFTKNNYTDEQNRNNALLLINFNLSNKLYISYNNLLFLNIFFGYNINSSDKNELILIQLLSNSNNKINILPFCSDFNEIFLKEKKYQDIFEKYYMNNMTISLKENNLYFEEIKSKYLSSEPSIYYQSLELFNVLNIGNYNNICNILELLNKFNNNKNRININFIFGFKMIMNFLSINCCIQNRINYGLNNLFGILNTLDLNMEEINTLLKEIFFFQSISFINNCCHNILLYNKEYQVLIKSFMEAKKKLIDWLINTYHGEKISDNILFSSQKIFLVKHAIINSINDKEISNKYNTLKNLYNFNDIKEVIKDNAYLQDKIYDIYKLE